MASLYDTAQYVQHMLVSLLSVSNTLAGGITTAETVRYGQVIQLLVQERAVLVPLFLVSLVPGWSSLLGHTWLLWLF